MTPSGGGAASPSGWHGPGSGSSHYNHGVNDFVASGTEVGFFTDATLCIGCKACEVACKEWNGVPDDGHTFTGRSYDNTGALGASTWRHVKFVEAQRPLAAQVTGEEPFRWVFLSDVCKHCEHAGCLEACPTGSIIRTEVGSVFVQDDVCNGCGYCVVACPFGVIDRRPDPQPGAGGAYKCTLCYDRQVSGMAPACAHACPTASIRFGPLEELRREAAERLEILRARGFDDAALYDPPGVGGTHAFFLLPGDPAEFGLPERPLLPSEALRPAWESALATSLMLVALIAWALLFS